MRLLNNPAVMPKQGEHPTTSQKWENPPPQQQQGEGDSRLFMERCQQKHVSLKL